MRLAAGYQVAYARPAFDGDAQFILAAFPSVMHDGRGTNRPWLLELSDPVTRITWHSWVEIHPDTARAMNIAEGEILRLTSPHGTLEAPAYLYPGLQPDTVAAPLGWGHTAFGAFARGRGANPLDLLGAEDGNGYLPYLSTRVKVEKTGRWKQVAKTEGTTREMGRGIVGVMTAEALGQGLTLEEFERNEGHPHEQNPRREV